MSLSSPAVGYKMLVMCLEISENCSGTGQKKAYFPPKKMAFVTYRPTYTINQRIDQRSL